WLPLTYAVNSLNRSMGLADFYPFVLTAGVRAKLRFIHDVVREVQQTADQPSGLL
ncbi:MAG: putative zinc-binding metallopeptidase, partial [Acetobacter sp.]|nr:putative zinc-binding metallopeptidase [Acetobacter sp.]